MLFSDTLEISSFECQSQYFRVLMQLSPNDLQIYQFSLKTEIYAERLNRKF